MIRKTEYIEVYSSSQEQKRLLCVIGESRLHLGVERFQFHSLHHTPLGSVSTGSDLKLDSLFYVR
jgi:hypothetical protein